MLDFHDHKADLLSAAAAAGRAIAPAFPLSATVAVNPFLGQADQDLAQAQARLARVAGVRLTAAPQDFARAIAAGDICEADLADALAAHASTLQPADLMAFLAVPEVPLTPLPTLADLAARVSGIDWPAVFARSFGLWAAGRFDQGQALWTPAPGSGAFAAWREWATHDLTPEIAGLTGFCAHVAAAPDDAERAILRACERLGIDAAAAETAFHRLLIDLGGWAQHARWLMWQAELSGGTDSTLRDLLAIRLIWEEALLARFGETAAYWSAAVAAHASAVQPGQDMIAAAILQDAAERAYQRRLAAALAAAPASPAVTPRAQVQAAFCIDVRSEVIRRALEAQDPGIETIGFAGFFGLPVAHRDHGTEELSPHLPVLLSPRLITTSHAGPDAETHARVNARARRAWGRFRQAAVSSFAFVEAAGPAYGVKLLKDALGAPARTAEKACPPRFETALTPKDRAHLAATVLRAMGLTQEPARLVLLLGHGAQLVNNPQQSAYQCGACGGHTGEVSARLLADLLNDAETRAGLPDHGVHLPGDTVFLAGLHDTTTDEIALYADATPASHAAELVRLRRWLAGAGAMARAERAARLPGATSATVAARAINWAEVRPEWGLAGCASFVAAPRAVTAAIDLQGRAFLHSYDWRQDAGFATLELILTAPVVVASWISLQYYGSAVAPDVFGGGNKLIHNVVGGIGVVQGNGGTLRAGLPWQALHDGNRPSHNPLRLSVLIDAPTEAMADILARNPQVRALFDNGWLHLLALKDGKVVARYRPDLNWQAEDAAPTSPPQSATEQTLPRQSPALLTASADQMPQR